MKNELRGCLGGYLSKEKQYILLYHINSILFYTTTILSFLNVRCNKQCKHLLQLRKGGGGVVSETSSVIIPPAPLLQYWVLFVLLNLALPH